MGFVRPSQHYTSRWLWHLLRPRRCRYGSPAFLPGAFLARGVLTWLTGLPCNVLFPGQCSGEMYSDGLHFQSERFAAKRDVGPQLHSLPGRLRFVSGRQYEWVSKLRLQRRGPRFDSLAVSVRPCRAAQIRRAQYAAVELDGAARARP